jgi:hypothetical protein
MTKEFPMTNAKVPVHAASSSLSFGFRHFLVISASSLVIHLLVFAIRLYRWTISPAQVFLFGSTAGCRFTPTCSQYAMDAVRERGVLTGGVLAAKRICRCHPWGGCGHDPVSKAEVGSEKVEGRIVLGNAR